MSLKERLKKAISETKRKTQFAIQCGIHPRQVGSPFMSNPEHVQCILNLIKTYNARILEIGPGDGVITYPLLENGYRTVTAIEINRAFYRRLKKQNHPRLTAIQGDASRLEELAKQGIINPPFDYVINGVPLDVIKDTHRFLTFMRAITREAYIHYSVRDRFELLCQYFNFVGEQKINGRRVYVAKSNATYRSEEGN